MPDPYGGQRYTLHLARLMIERLPQPTPPREVTIQTGLTPLAGREYELGVLRERWTQAQTGEGQVVLLSGEAGIGKSRLVQELKDQTKSNHKTFVHSSSKS